MRLSAAPKGTQARPASRRAITAPSSIRGPTRLSVRAAVVEHEDKASVSAAAAAAAAAEHGEPKSINDFLSALMSGGKPPALASAPSTPAPTTDAPPAASSARHPLLGSRMLNLSPGVTPSVLAAAMGGGAHAATVGTEQQVLGGAASLNGTPGAKGEAGAGKASAATGAPSGGNGTALAAAAAAEGMVSEAEVQSLLSGLKASLESIQSSRAQYVRLLADRDNMVMELRVQLRDKEQRLKALENDLHGAQAAALQAELDAEAAAELAAAAAEQVQLQAQQIDEATAAAKAAREAALAAVAQQQLLIEQQQQAAAELAALQKQQSPPPPQAKQAPTKEVVIYYRTHWRQVNAHYSADGKGWTTNPGVPMEGTKDNQIKVLRVPASKLEVVFNNGRGEWDSPQGNYRINSPGTYRIEHGNLRQA